LEGEIAKRRRTLQASEEEVAALHHHETLLAQQFTSTKARSTAELMQARDAIQQAQDRQAVDVRVAARELKNAIYKETQTRKLAERGLVSQDTLREATERVHEAQEKLARVRLPVEQGRLAVLQRTLELTEREYAMQRQELRTKQGLKQGEVETLRI